MTMKPEDVAFDSEKLQANTDMNARADTTIATSRTLGIGELLNAPHMKPELKAQAARNALVPVLSGIAAIGDWMTQDAAHDELQSETMSNTGYLLTFLANLASDLHYIETVPHAPAEDLP